MAKGGNTERWAFLSALDVGTGGDPYLDRLRLIQTPLFGIYLHHIHRPDRDRDPHDHPWWFASLVLCGGYEETVWPDKHVTGGVTVRRRGRFSAASLSRDAAHIITMVRSPLWTLVVTGPKRGDWGFWDADARFIPWREYLGLDVREAHGGQ